MCVRSGMHVKFLNTILHANIVINDNNGSDDGRISGQTEEIAAEEMQVRDQMTQMCIQMFL